MMRTFIHSAQAAAIVAALIGCGSITGECRNDVIADLVSPGGELRAVVFQRDCGATTGFSTHVSLLPTAQVLPDSSGNVFVADTDHGRAPAGPRGGPDIHMEWSGSGSLEVRHDPRIRIFKRETHLSGTEVRFVSASIVD